jgi:hypothetical protein
MTLPDTCVETTYTTVKLGGHSYEDGKVCGAGIITWVY